MPKRPPPRPPAPRNGGWVQDDAKKNGAARAPLARSLRDSGEPQLWRCPPAVHPTSGTARPDDIWHWLARALEADEHVPDDVGKEWYGVRALPLYAEDFRWPTAPATGPWPTGPTGAPTLNRRAAVHPHLGDSAMATLAGALLRGSHSPALKPAIGLLHGRFPHYGQATGPTLAWLLGRMREWARQDL